MLAVYEGEKAVEEKRYIYRIRHDVYGTAEVIARDMAEASQAAAEKWNVPWREIAGWCDAERAEEVRKVRCAGCGGEYYGRAGGLCTDCMRKKAYRRATVPKFKRRDRRA